MIRFCSLMIFIIVVPHAYADAPFEWIEPNGLGIGDYAKDRLGNPWNMDDTTGIETHHIAQMTSQNGILEGITDGSDPWISLDLEPLDLPDTHRYGTVGFRFMRSPGGPVGIYWRDETNQWHHQSLISPGNEWITPVFDLWEDPEWSGRCTAFRLDPSTASGVYFRLDWLTMTEGDVASDGFVVELNILEAMDISLQYRAVETVTWTPLPSAQGLEADVGYFTHYCDFTSLDGGSYYEIRAICERPSRTDTIICPAFLRLNRAPILDVTGPGEDIVILEGPDFATLRGNPWDMEAVDDIGACGGMDDIQCQNGILTARTTNTDPWIAFSGDDIDASQFTTVGWYMKVSRSGRYAVHWMDEGGNWHHSGLHQSARAGVWQFYTQDLSCEPSWSGNISRFRIDPTTYEDVLVEIDWVRLVDPSDTSIPITWDSWDDEENTALEFICHDSESGEERDYAVETIYPGNGTGNHSLDVSAMPPGTYTLKSILDDGAHPLLDDSADGNVLVESRGNLPPSVSVISPNSETPRLPDVDEFSRDILEDPWDFEELSDGFLYHNFTDLSVESGTLTAVTATDDPYFWLLFQGYYSAQNIGKTGQRYPIDPSRHSLLSFRMYIDEPSVLRIFWYRGSNGAPSDCDTLSHTISEPIQLSQGWNTYRVDLRTLGVDQSTGPGAWSNHDVINGLRIDPASHAGRTIGIDWFRLSGQGHAGTKIDVSWQVEDDLQEAEIGIFVDDDDTGFNGMRIYGPAPATEDIETISYCTAHLPYPGFHVYAEVCDGVNEPVRCYAPAPVTINAPPLVIIREPDELGATSFTATPEGDTWDMDTWSDIDMLVNIDDPHLFGGELTGISTNSNPDDPLADSQVHLAFTEPINTRRFPAVRFRQWVDEWSVLRLLWRHTNTSLYQATDDFVVYPGWNEFVVGDINDLVLEYATAQDWTGYINDIFRIDPSELRNSIFRLDYIELFTRDMTHDNFELKAEITDPDDAVTLEWYWTPATESPDSHLICQNVQCQEGVFSTIWDLSDLPGGSYHVYCIGDDGLNRTKHHARGELILNRIPSFQFIEPDGTDDRVDPGTDYATVELNDPWDMETSSDIDVLSGFDDIQWTNGSFDAVTTCSDPYLLWNRTGSPIDAGIYSTISFQLFVDHTQDSNTRAMVYWKRSVDGSWYHSNFITLHEGCNTIIVSLADDYPQTWTETVSILRIDPVAAPDVRLALDWVRLSKPGSADYDILWSASDPDDDAIIRISCSASSLGGGDVIITEGVTGDNGTSSFTWDLSPYPPDVYSLRAVIDDGINAPQSIQSPNTITLAPCQEVLDLTGYVVDGDTLRLSWNEPDGEYALFRIYRSTMAHCQPAPQYLLAETSGTVYYADISDAIMNTDYDYYFRVTWINSQQVESPPSNGCGTFSYCF